MNDLNSILSGIRSSADAEIKRIGEETEKEIQRLNAECEKKLSDEKARSDAEIAKYLANVSASGASSAESAYKREIRKAENEGISEIINSYLEKMRSLPDAEYFAFLAKLCDKYSDEKECMVYLSSADKKRDRAIFASELEKISIGARKFSLADEYSDEISSGCIVSYGKIGENLSFESILSDKSDEIRDALYSALYGGK